jgi:integrase
VLEPAAAAGLAPLGFHQLRYTATSELIDVGVPIKQVQVWLGHHSPELTMAVYARARAGDVPDLDALYRVRDAARGSS